jgi:ribosomal protein L11 methyltransferase
VTARQRLFIMRDPAWLEISLLADGEMAEAISEVLARFVSGGVVIESTQIADEPNGEGTAMESLRVYGYLPFDDQLEVRKQKILESLWHLGQILPVPEVQTRPVEDLDWSEVWKEHFQPIQIGEELIIIPVWMEIKSDQRIAIKIDPGLAFGTGTHPTTQLCLEIIAEQLGSKRTSRIGGSRSVQTMVDVGCGSGILGIAALKLGVDTVLGVDLDPEAVKSARKNAAINGIDQGLQLEVGSLEEVMSGKYLISSGTLVVANILAPVIIRMLAAGLGELLTNEGKLILPGILEEQEPEVLNAIRAAGLRLVDKKKMGDWIALVAVQH